MVRPGGDGGGSADVPDLVDLRTDAGTDLRAGECGGRADYRLPLRHGAGHPHLDNGRHWPRRRARRAVP
ncbi:hypothetical protein D3C80_746810 [compost metagenome]